MNSPVAPSGIAPPAANYAHALLTGPALDGPTRWLHTSGVVPVRPDGSVADGLGEQAAEVWRTIGALLQEADMQADDIVSVTTYVVAPADATELPLRMSQVMAARDTFMAGHLAASTLVTVPMLAQPTWQVEVAIVACR